MKRAVPTAGKSSANRRRRDVDSFPSVSTGCGGARHKHERFEIEQMFTKPPPHNLERPTGPFRKPLTVCTVPARVHAARPETQKHECIGSSSEENTHDMAGPMHFLLSRVAAAHSRVCVYECVCVRVPKTDKKKLHTTSFPGDGGNP